MMRLMLFISCLAALVDVSCNKIGTPATSNGQAVTPAEHAGRSTLSYEEQQGMYVYIQHCAVCHGSEGKGDGFNAYNLEPKPRDFTDSTYMRALSDSRLFETISEGGRGVNRSPLMPTWGATLSKDEILNAVSYLRTFARRTKPGK